MHSVNKNHKQSRKYEGKFKRRARGSAALAIFAFAGLFVGAAQVRAQAAAPKAAPLTFDVASIKPSEDIMVAVSAGRAPHVGMKVDNQSVDFGYYTLAALITYAYKVKAYQVTGPDWMKTAHWDIQATLPEGSNKDQIPEMMQALLADRFKLVAHHDSKEMPVLVLGVGKNGVKMAVSPPDPPAVDKPDDKDGTVVDTGNGQVRVKSTGTMGAGGTAQISGGPAGNVKMSVDNGFMHMESSKMTMEILSQQLSQFLQQPVIDETELKGTYVAAVDISVEDLQAVARAAGFAVGGPGPAANSTGVPSAGDPSGGSVYASVEKLGLKLNKEKLPVDVIVVDHLEKAPTAN
jgi:uncharacterized protein (TIGR03435 family)